jgi:hypothetical protein
VSHGGCPVSATDAQSHRQPLPGSVGLRHPPDGRQQIGDQLCLENNIIRAGGHRRLPGGAVVQQGQSDDAHTGQHRPQAGDGLQAGPVQADQNHLWPWVLSLGQGLLAPTQIAPTAINSWCRRKTLTGARRIGSPNKQPTPRYASGEP